MRVSIDAIIFPMLMLGSAVLGILTATSQQVMIDRIFMSVIGFGWMWMVVFAAERIWDEWTERRRNGESWARIMGMDDESLKRLSSS